MEEGVKKRDEENESDRIRKMQQSGSFVVTVNKLQTARLEHDGKMVTDASNLVSIKSSRRRRLCRAVMSSGEHFYGPSLLVMGNVCLLS